MFRCFGSQTFIYSLFLQKYSGMFLEKGICVLLTRIIGCTKQQFTSSLQKTWLIIQYKKECVLLEDVSSVNV